jgi:hypothetical protein
VRCSFSPPPAPARASVTRRRGGQIAREMKEIAGEDIREEDIRGLIKEADLVRPSRRRARGRRRR